MSGVLIKTGIYGMVRMCAFGLGRPDLMWGVVVLALGGVSAVLGVLYALMQHDLKRLLAYHSIENIGIILLGLGAGMVGLAYGRCGRRGRRRGRRRSTTRSTTRVFKALLFLGAGNVVLATGTRNIEEFGGLIRRMPWTAVAFLIGAVAISGLPPFNGFVSEWLTLQTFLFGFRSSSAPSGPPDVPAGRRAARADGRAGRGLLREGVRHHVPGATAQRGRGVRGGGRRHAASCRSRCSRSVRRARPVPRRGARRPRDRDRRHCRASARRRLAPSAWPPSRRGWTCSTSCAPASSRWCSRPASASPRCWPRSAASAAVAEAWGCGGRAGRGRRVHRHGVLEAVDDDLRAPSTARRARSSRWATPRPTSRRKCGTRRRSSRPSSGTSTAP